jgi:hypothetical protein
MSNASSNQAALNPGWVVVLAEAIKSFLAG